MPESGLDLEQGSKEIQSKYEEYTGWILANGETSYRDACEVCASDWDLLVDFWDDLVERNPELSVCPVSDILGFISAVYTRGYQMCERNYSIVE